MNSSEKQAYDKWQQTFEFELDCRRPLKCKFCRKCYKYIQSFEDHIKEEHMDKVRWTVSDEQIALCKRLDQLRKGLTTQPEELNTMYTFENTHSKVTRNFSVIITNPNC